MGERYDLDNPEHVDLLGRLYDAAGLGRRRPTGGGAAVFEIVLPREGPRRDAAPVAVGAAEALRRLRAPGRSGKRLAFEERLREAVGSGRILYTHGPGWHAWEDGPTPAELRACRAALDRRGLAGLGFGIVAPIATRAEVLYQARQARSHAQLADELERFIWDATHVPGYPGESHGAWRQRVDAYRKAAGLP